MDLLCDYPDQWALLDQLELVPHAVGEAMRYRPIGFALPRIATEYLELAGVCIPAGTIVFANTAAANRDPAAFSDPDRFDITGDNMVGTLSFGNGAHYWLGSHLARLELAQALTVMAQRMPNLRRTGPARWPSMIGVTGPTHSAPRIRPRTLNPLTSHELRRLPMRTNNRLWQKVDQFLASGHETSSNVNASSTEWQSPANAAINDSHTLRASIDVGPPPGGSALLPAPRAADPSARDGPHLETAFGSHVMRGRERPARL